MKAKSKRERMRQESEEQRPQSDRALPGYGDVALEIFGKGRRFESNAQELMGDDISTGIKTAELGVVQAVADTPPIEGDLGQTESSVVTKRRISRKSKTAFVPDYRSPTVNRTTKLRDDQHRCLKEDVPEWVADYLPEHPNLRRFVTIEFLTQMAIDDLLTDDKIVERIVERIQKACMPV